MSVASCPRCTSTPTAAAGPYRRAAGAERGPVRTALRREQHRVGIEIDRCPTCGGAFLDAGELEAVERGGKAARRQPGAEAALEMFQRSHQLAKRPDDAVEVNEEPPLDCPRCGETMFEREWSTTLVMVDVCLDCRGVWLDAGELESLERMYGA
ncbi:MAG: zf-TFIIB domain-containing protein [Polyangiaceae bacterium]|nr:zf-TFIIB domain-containing protein [Polyangiaceae bacterium]MBK8939057.1 zf-TFIIB domain-containing protein [Polyangiaceae bacterium]